jgi:hypothetical protein
VSAGKLSSLVNIQTVPTFIVTTRTIYGLTPNSDSLSPELSAHSLFRLTLTTGTIGSLSLPPLTTRTISSLSLPPHSHQNYRLTLSSASLSPELSVHSLFRLTLTRTIGSLCLPPHSHQNYRLTPFHLTLTRTIDSLPSASLSPELSTHSLQPHSHQNYRLTPFSPTLTRTIDSLP